MKCARDLMTRDVLTVTEETLVADLVDLLSERRLSGAPVVDAERRVLSVVSMSDVLRAATRGGGSWVDFYTDLQMDRLEEDGYGEVDRSLRVKDLTGSEVYRVDADTSLADTVKLMLAKKIHRVLVTDSEGRLEGLISSFDLLNVIPELVGTP